MASEKIDGLTKKFRSDTSQSDNIFYRSRQLALFSALLFCICITLAAVWEVVESRQQTLKQAENRDKTTSFLISEWISGSFREVDHAVRTLVAGVGPEDFSNSSSERKSTVKRFLQEQIGTIRHLAEMGYLDNTCHVANAVYTAVGVDFGQREYCIAMRNNPDMDQYISKLIFGNLNKFEIVYLRKIRDQHGQPVGIAAAGMDLSFFQQWLGRVNIGEQDVVAITDLDGHLLARVPQLKPGSLGEIVPDLQFIQRIQRGDIDGRYETQSPFDERSRFIYFKRIDNLPFIVVVASDKDNLLMQWHHKLWAYLIALGVIYLLSWFSVREHFRIVDQTIELHSLATTDTLTGVVNRRLLMERLEIEVQRAERYPQSLSILLLDIDHFKR